MDIYDAIFYRKSIRNFSFKKVKDDLINEIENVCLETSNDYIKAEVVKRGHLVELLLGKKCEFKAQHYIIVSSKYDDLIELGFYAEEIILKLTTLGVATCFVDFNDELKKTRDSIKESNESSKNSEKELEDTNDEELYSQDDRYCIAIAFGYASEEDMFRNKYDKIDRKPLRHICRNINREFKDIIELSSLAPSYKNSQPWILYRKNNCINFYLEKRHRKHNDLYKVSMGAFIKHFDIACNKYGKSVKYTKKEENKKFMKEYLLSAIIDNNS